MITVFTAVLGETDPLRAPIRVQPGVRYLVFTNRRTRVPPYRAIDIPADVLGPRLTSRQLKILANHPELDGARVTLWHDAAYQLDCDVPALARRELAESDLVAFRHPWRNQIADEAEAIAALGYMPRATLAAQVAAYQAEGFTQTAITSTGFCLRRHTSAVEAFQACWWGEVSRWGWRDQMSVDYALWKTGVAVRYIPGHYRDNPYARWSCYHPRVSRAS